MEEEEIYIISMGDIYPYNEYDSVLNGGFYSCPSCGEQEYIAEAIEGEINSCDECKCKYRFVEERN